MYKMLINFPIQFQLNRLSKCEMHAAIDGISTLDLVFPIYDGCLAEKQQIPIL
jgi:hypothetical protein